MKRKVKCVVENCYICKTNLETTEHLLDECETVWNLWESVHDLISSGSRNIDFWPPHDTLLKNELSLLQKSLKQINGPHTNKLYTFIAEINLS